MKFHIILEANNTAERIAELARLAESYDMAGIWVSNMHDARDPFINFTEAARTTERIGLGPVAVSPYELHPLKMANALLTLNELAGGRAHIGVGAGDGGTATAMGMPAIRRVRAVRECVEIIEAAATAEPVSSMKAKCTKSCITTHPGSPSQGPKSMSVRVGHRCSDRAPGTRREYFLAIIYRSMSWP